MKKIIALFGLVWVIFGCSQIELCDPNEVGGQPMKTVTISAYLGGGIESKASLDSDTGSFSWQSGDFISVLATDGKFYDFVLNEGVGNKIAEFEGTIPENAEVTTVATYPRIVSNGSENTILTENILSYNLPSEWIWMKDVSNVPMVATFAEGAEDMSFKQVGGVMRFPVKNLPKEAKFVVTMNDKTITGEFPVDITTLGESVMTAGNTASVLIINYSSDVDGASAEFNVPLPVGVYNNFNVTIKDAEDNDLYSKNYSANNKVERKTLLIMSELTLPERQMVAEVWPFYVDARVVFPKSDGVTQYAAYVDGATEPVILDAEDWGNNSAVLIGGEFDHNTLHTVAVAKILDGNVVLESMSEPIQFKTADIRQLTTNTGTKFVSVGWDDVAVSWGPKYENGKWTAVSKADVPDGDLKLHQRRGYQVQLLAADEKTVLYDFIPFDGHAAHTSPFSDSSWLGKIASDNILIPTALSFGYLEPGKDYYFRVKTLDEPVTFDVTKGNYNPEDNGGQPYPYVLLSENGGCAWSKLVKLSTDPAHIPSANEIFYEGFDDIQVANDYVNWAPGVVPDLQTVSRQSWDEYYEGVLPTAFPEFLKNPKGQGVNKWNAQAFSETVRSYFLGLNPEHSIGNSVFNESAGSMKDWTIFGESEKRTVYPIFGAIRLGQSGSNKNGVKIATPAINSDKLISNRGTKCIITVNVAYCKTNTDELTVPTNFYIQRIFGENLRGEQVDLSARESYPEEYASWVEATHHSKNDYIHYQRYYELSCQMYLRKGESLLLGKYHNNDNKGFLVIGDVKVEVVPGEYEPYVTDDSGIGTEPDDTNYDVYGLGEFPITYWWTPPTAVHNYDDVKTRELYKDIAEAGMNIVLYNGEVDQSLAENIRIMNIANDLGMKFIGQLNDPTYSTNAAKIEAIKDNLASSPAYVGEYISDEPPATEFDRLGEFTEAYLREIPNKEVYINLFPGYASSDQLGSPTYEDHINQYLTKVPTKSLSYDFYPLKESGVNTKYYENLDLVRFKTLELRKPFWVITQAGGKVGKSNAYPTENDQRWNVWSTIALGSKGIAYFCYWNPWGSDEENYVSALVNRDGQKTEQYEWIKSINSDIKTIGKKLLPCHSDGAILGSTVNYPLYQNEGRGRTSYGPIQSAVGTHSILVGCFRDARVSEKGENYKGYKAMVMSEMPGRNFTATLTLDTNVDKITFTNNNTEETLSLTNGLSTKVGNIDVSFDGANLILKVPVGEAVLLEF